ncbi:MAG: radical SAM protein [Candidatus Omnitrophica bacterium]|nr:radical SAM protein [Candidatus Omnitrophota bacterium]MDD5352614.1 radical SAM protein [Candidatus Omnitrophota bacterium]MDD5550212.1 radical SAM protein [Candidatus Omnitrophota bacterium]
MDRDSLKKVNEFAIFLTEDCNVRCDFCHIKKNRRNISFDTLKKSFLFIEENCQRKGTIGFYGGEPLLAYSLIEKIIKFVKKRNILKEYSFNIMTNGTLLNNEIILFCKENKIKLEISLTGLRDARHNHRVFNKSRMSTWESTIKNIKKVEECSGDYNVIYLISPDNVKFLKNSLLFLLEAGIREIYLTPVISKDWTKKSYSDFKNNFLICKSVYPYFRNMGITIYPFSKSGVNNDVNKTSSCCSGRSVAIDVYGNILTCPFTNSLDSSVKKEYIIGNIFSNEASYSKSFVCRSPKDDCRNPFAGCLCKKNPCKKFCLGIYGVSPDKQNYMLKIMEFIKTLKRY